MIRLRVEKSIEQLNRDWLENQRIPIDIMHDFIDSADEGCLEARLAALSPDFREALVRFLRRNIIAFDAIVAETVAAGDYVDGWTAVRDWTRRQPWAAEAWAEMEPIMARMREQEPRPAGPEDPVRDLGEQGRMLGILRVQRMRAQTDEERDAITKEIEELTARFEELNRA